MPNHTISPPFVGRWHSPAGYRSVLVVKLGRRHLHVVVLHRHKVRVERLDIIEHGLMWQLTIKGKPYPVARAKRRFKSMIRTYGATKEARAALAAL